jgi:CRISPR/Cas system CSM-associated protein Csm3 (group 7 of RAMP superfamily)
MPQEKYQKNSSGIQERLIVTGKLEFTSPAIFQANDTDDLTDFVILRDEIDQSPLLPGNSLAGALRSYLLKSLPISDATGLDQASVNALFGDVNGKRSTRSWLFIEDALGVEKGIEIRDGVRIDPATLTAENKGKYDMELLAAGTSFDLEFELRLPKDEKAKPDNMLTLFYTALTALEEGHIRLGGKKTRGLGECKVNEWQVYRYRMNDKKDIIRWLKDERSEPEPGSHLYEKLGFASKPAIPADETLRVIANFAIDKTIMVRSYSADPKLPDMVHMQNSAGDPIIPGTSIAGVLRAQARRIAALKMGSEKKAETFVNKMFGSEKADKTGKLTGSRLIVSEAVIEGPVSDIIQNRVKIDPFTGGTYPGALFNEKPHLHGTVQMEFVIYKPEEQEVGMMLLLLKDLWDGFLPIGGESSIGRGRLTGIDGSLEWQGKTYELTNKGGNLKISPEEDDLLFKAIQSLNADLAGGV